MREYNDGQIRHSLREAGYEPVPHAAVSLYAHVPFCRTRCHYCAFYLETGYPPRVLNETLEGMIHETRFWVKALGQPRMRTVYIGGGTPSVVPPEQLARFLDQLVEVSPSVADVDEATMEVNPESVRPELVETLRTSFVNRISMGIQSLNNDELAVLGRRSDRETALRALEYLIGHFDGKISVDLIVGTPGQTAENLAEGIRVLLSMGISHVSLYGLTVEPKTVLEQQVQKRMLHMPSHDVHEDLWDCASTVLRDSGLYDYEVSNYAVPGHESRHNAGYWNLDPYVGIGPGAVGMVYARSIDARETVQAVRVTGRDVFSYQKWKQGIFAPAVETLANADYFFEHFMNGLRTSRGVNLDVLSGRFGVAADDILAVLRDYWSEYPSLHSYTGDAGERRVRLDREKRMILDHVLPDLWAILDTYGPPPVFRPYRAWEDAT